MGQDGQAGRVGSWAVEGIGEDFVPDIADMSLVTEALRSTTRKVLPPRASSCGRKGFSAVPPPARCSRVRCAIAASKRNRNGSSPSFATPATNIFPRCITISGWRSRDSSSAHAGRFERSDFAPLRSGRSHFRRADRHVAYRFQTDAPADVSQVPVVDENGRAVGISMSRTCW